LKIELYEWTILAIDREGRQHRIPCPTEAIAEQILDSYNGMLAVKIPSRMIKDGANN